MYFERTRVQQNNTSHNLRPKHATLSLCARLCVFMFSLRLQFSHCLNSLVPSWVWTLMSMGLSVPSTLISPHWRLHCDQQSPPTIICQLLRSSLPDIILKRCRTWISPRGPDHCGIQSNILCETPVQLRRHVSFWNRLSLFLPSRRLFAILSFYRGDLIKSKLCA